jgi:hypothetical protein
MAPKPPTFFNPESIDYDTYKSGPVDFYNQAIDVESMTGTGRDNLNPDELSKF